MLVLGKRSECEVSLSLYELIYELNKIEPPVLLAVLPQLEFKLKVGVLFNLLNLILSQIFEFPCFQLLPLPVIVAQVLEM